MGEALALGRLLLNRRLSGALTQLIRGCHVVEQLEWVNAEHGLPRAIQVDNGPEFISKDLDLWAYWNGVKLDFSRPGKPTDNALIESFNSRFRKECLNEHWFLSLEDAQAKVELGVRATTGIGHIVRWEASPRATMPLGARLRLPLRSSLRHAPRPTSRTSVTFAFDLDPKRGALHTNRFSHSGWY